MPSYDYRCDTCHKRVLLSYKTYAEFDKATPTCTHCGSTSLTRWITRVAIAKSEERRFGGSEPDNDALDDLANADPSTIGRYMRRMSDDTGEDLGQEFNEVVERLEHGEAPEEIEASMEAPADEISGGMGDSLGDMGGFGDLGGGFAE